MTHVRKYFASLADSPESRTLLVSTFETPADGWKIEYSRPLPTEEDPQRAGPVPRRWMLSAKASPRRYSALLLGPPG